MKPKNNYIKFLIFLIVFTIYPLNGSDAQQFNIHVCSFNIANFGDTKEYERSLIDLVNIIRKADPDLLCLQEIEPNNLGKEQVRRLVDLLNIASSYYNTESYTFEIAEDYVGDETTAFLWREPVSIESEITLLEHDEDPDNDGKRVFQRVPSLALFKVGDVDFYVVNCHFYTKLKGPHSEGREEEFRILVDWLQRLEQESEKDAIVLGDFNRFLNGKEPWKQFVFTNYQQYYRFPILDAIRNVNPGFDIRKDEAPEDRFSTTTSKSKRIYDHIIVSSGLYDYIESTPTFGEDVGIIDFDIDPQFKWFIDKWSNATKMLSDHRPIWIKLSLEL